MLGNLKKTFNLNNEAELQEARELEYIEKMKDQISDSQNSINYLLKYPHYKDVLLQLISIKKYLTNKRNPTSSIVICLEAEGGNESHAYDSTASLLRNILNGVTTQRINESMFLNINSAVQKENKANIIEQFKGKYVFVKNIDSIVQDEDKSEKVKFLRALNFNTIIVYQGSKAELSMLLSELNYPSNFYFNLSLEYTFEEIRDLLYTMLNVKRGFALEKGWELALRLHLNKPSEMHKKKDYMYFKNLLMEIEKKTLTDPSGKKHQGKNIVLKKYFGFNEAKKSIANMESLKKLEKLIGMEEAKQSVLELIAYLEFNEKLMSKTGRSYPLNLHMMFTGNPGTGKTTIARIIASVLFELGYIRNSEIVEVDKKDLVSQWVGHTAQKTNEIIQQARGGVLFIDEAYSVSDDKFGKEAIATLIKAMEDYKTDLVVIVAGYEKEMQEFVDSNPGMSSRIGKKINFIDYSAEELYSMYEAKLKDFEITTSREGKEAVMQVIREHREIKNFGNGRFIDNFIQDIMFQFAVSTSGISIDEMSFEIGEESIPAKYLTVKNTFGRESGLFE